MGGMTDWKHDGVRVIPAGSLDTNTAQTPGMNRAAAINFARVGAQKLWAGTVTIHAHAKTGAHHHGHVVGDDGAVGQHVAVAGDALGQGVARLVGLERAGV